jgi:NHL repeat-containing protein
VDGQGRVITVDMIRQQISVFTGDGVFQGRFGGMGSAPGAVSYPSDVASDGNGRLYVVEREGNRLQVFEERGERPGRKSAPVSRAPDAVKQEMRRALGELLKSPQ